jgi:hypothetical protein
MDELLSRIAALRARLEAGPLGPTLERMQRGNMRVEAALRRGSARVSSRWRRGTAPARPAVEKATSAAHKVGEATSPGRPPILYRDGMVTLDNEGVVVSGYYLPFGRHRIPYDRIRAVTEHPLTSGREFRLHGFVWPRYWYHRDARRSERGVGLELQTDTLLWPVLTPKDVDAVKELIGEQLERRLERHGPTGGA